MPGIQMKGLPMRDLQRELSWAKSLFFILIFWGTGQLVWAQGQQIIFSATGDVPYGSGEVSDFQQQMINHNKYSPSVFLVHVGDIISGSESCDESKYSSLANIMKTLAVPAYITPGDNETVDCSNPASGYNLFMKYFKNYEQNFCGAPFAERQSARPENWAFTMNGVLFMGINLVYGGSSAQQDAAAWVTQQLQGKGSQVRAAAIFSHYAPNSSSTFSTPFRSAAAAFAKPVLFLHGHGHSWSTSYPFPEKNIFRVQVNKGGSEDPVQVTVTTDMTSPATAFILKRNPWSAKTIVNMPPCANAGPDQSIAGATVATLKGQATDDGDPSGTLTSTWSKVSGPGAVSFGNPNTPTTTASFSSNGSYILRLTANDGQLQKSDDVLISVNSSGGTAPTIASFTPTSGAAGTMVMISGSNFTGATGVAFNGSPAASFTVNSSTQIVATVPADATTGKIMITTSTSAGISANDFVVTGSNLNTFTFNPIDDAYVQSISPTSNFGTLDELRTETNSASDVAVIYLKFNATGVRGTLQNAKLRLRVTDGSTQGGAVFLVSNDYQDASGPWTETGLVWSNAPLITSTALSSLASVSSGQTVELNVTSAFTGNGIYSFALKSSSSNLAKYSSKEGTIKPELVIQTLPTPPKIASFTPASGTATTEVTITGSAFDGTTAVAFNGLPAAFTVDADTLMRATVPIDASTGMISATNPDGTGFSATNFTVLPPVTFSSFTPTSGPVGTEVTIVGNRFSSASAVTFNGTAATFIVDSNTQLRATVPAGATTGKISVTNAYGTNSTNANFVVTAPPMIASFTPSSGPPGTEVTISGSFFTGTTGVTINDHAATGLVVDSNSQIRVKVPAGAIAGTGKIVVTNAVGSDTSAADFTITVANIFTFSPQHDTYVNSSNPTSNNGTAGTLRGKMGASEVMQSYLKFAVTGLSGSLVSAKLRLYVSDASPDGGSLYLVSNNYNSSLTPWTESGLNWNNAPGITGTPLSSVGAATVGQWMEFDVAPAIVGNGTYSFGLKNSVSDVVYYRSKENGAETAPQLVVQTTPSSAPSIASFGPDNGPEDTEVTIIGNNFIGTTSVTFNGTPATIFAVDSNTKLRANVPGNATTGRISVTNAHGSASYAKDFVVTATPEIIAFSPSSGSAGDEITIAGSNFTGTTSVKFNDQAASAIHVDSDAQIRATIPLNAVPGAGKIAVTNSAGSATSAADFAINMLLTFAPTHDTYVSSSSPATNYGTASTMRVKMGSSEIFYAYLKFDVTGLSGAMISAKLRLYVMNASENGGSVYSVSNDYLSTATPWMETGMNWTNAPSISGTPLSAVGAAADGKWVEFDVTSAITGNGTYSFGLMSNNSDAVYYGSKESSATTNDPQLVIQMALPPAQHTLAVNTVGSGSVMLNPPSANGSYDVGATVQLTAIPDAGFQFSGWSGDLSPAGATNPATITMDGNKNVTATFTVISSSSAIVHEETQTGGSSNLTTVATSTNLTGANGHLYLAAISMQPRQNVETVSGLGLTWTLVKAQCSGLNTTGVEVWMAQGTPNGNGAVTATLASAPTATVIAVSRYSGVVPPGGGMNPIGNIVSGNTNGANASAACSSGVPSASYAFDLATTMNDAVVYSAVTMKARTHAPGADYTERAEIKEVGGGLTSSIAVEDKKVAAAGNVTVNGSFSGAADWAEVGLEIKPQVAVPGQYLLTLNTVGSGNVALDPAGGIYETGTVVTLVPQGGTGFQFSGWSGDLSGSTNPATITMNGNKNVTAIFVTGDAIVHEETQTGGSSNSTTVATSANLTGANGHLYLAAISMQPRVNVLAVSGLGLNWTLVKKQCSGLNTIAVEVWMAQGLPSGNEAVTATLASAPSATVIAVSRYSGVVPTGGGMNPIGNVISGNTNGANASALCSGGVPSASYAFDLATTVDDAVVYSAVGMKARTHAPGADYAERAEIKEVGGGLTSSIAVEDKKVAAAGSVMVDGSFSGTSDWAEVGLELKPQATMMSKRGAMAGDEKLAALPSAYRLEQNYPNPFNPATSIRYSMPQDGHVRLTIYDLFGQIVAVPVDGFHGAGTYRLDWQAVDARGYVLPSGIYFYRLEAGAHVVTRRMTLLR
jgi:hypothetical protein